MMKMGRGYSGMVGGPGQDRNDLCAPPYPSPSLNHRNVTERSLGTKRRANAPRTPSHGPQAAPRGGSTFPHFTSTATKAQRGRLTTRGHTGIGPTQRVEYYSRPGGFTPLGAPPSGRSRPEPLLLPAPEGRPGGRAEEVSAAGRNVSGRGTPARGGGDSQAGGRGGGRGGAEHAGCLISPWCRWTGRDAATMTTSRVSVGWTTGSAPTGRTRRVRTRPEGSLAGAGAGAGKLATRGPLSHRRRPVRAHVDAGPTFLRLSRRQQSLTPRAQKQFSSAPGARACGRASLPAPAPPLRAAGGGCRRGQACRASRAARGAGSAEPPSLALPGWEQRPQLGPQTLHFLPPVNRP